MPVLSTPAHLLETRTRTRRFLVGRSGHAQRLVVGVDRVGYLVPRTDFRGHVHSVFEKSCNVALDDRLLTICDSRAGEGPATLRLAGAGVGDLRNRFNVGEPVACNDGRMRSGRVDLQMCHASVWRPAEPRPLLPPARIDAHLRSARTRLAQQRRTHSSIVDREGAAVVAALMAAVHALDIGRATLGLDRLIGWGEGLTPAGDDFLVGLIAALNALVQGDERRRGFCGAIGLAIGSRIGRTTPIAAHYLHLAAGGHFTEPIVVVRDALLSEDQEWLVDAAVQRVLDIGATSGADTLSGLLAGLHAWLSPQPMALAA